jgi:PAS domain S-box-containing protein
MTNTAIVDIVRQQLAVGTSPSAEQTHALLAQIESLQQQLNAANELLAQSQVIAELSSDYTYIFRVEADGRLIREWVTEAFTRIIGYTSQELDARGGWAILIHPDDRPIAARRLQNLLAGNKDEREFRIITKAGEIRWLYDCAQSQWDADQGRVVRILGAASDITDRKHAEERLHVLAHASALLSSSLDYDKTLDQIAHLAVPLLADGCFVDLLADEDAPRRLIIAHADAEKEELLCETSRQYPLDGGWPQPIADVVQTQKPALLADISDSSLRNMLQQQPLLSRLNVRSAMIVPLLVHERIFGTLIFVSEQERRRYTQDDLSLAEELGTRAALAFDNARLYREARNAVEARDEFLSIAAHELKTPTAVLVSASQLLRVWLEQLPESSERIKRELNVIAMASQRLNKLIDSLTEFAQMQIGRFSLASEPVLLCAVVRQVLDDVQATPKHYVALFCPDETLTVQGDALRLERVFYNLLQNAIKYSPHGGPITVRVERQEHQAVIRVADQGIGIPEAARPQLFQRFYRAPNAMQQHIGGIGIGLYLVKEIVVRHGGEIEVSSLEGYGSTFTIRLPLSR